jgi:hypothetical protein
MVSIDSPCRLRVGIQGFGNISLDGVNGQSKKMVGVWVVLVFLVCIRPLAKASFLLILTL